MLRYLYTADLPDSGEDGSRDGGGRGEGDSSGGGRGGGKEKGEGSKDKVAGGEGEEICTFAKQLKQPRFFFL